MEIQFAFQPAARLPLGYYSRRSKVAAELCEAEATLIHEFIQSNTLERFGPVRTVKPEIVFEITFEVAEISKRHKAGLVLRSPKIRLWRQDIPASSADSLDQVRGFILHHAAGGNIVPGGH